MCLWRWLKVVIKKMFCLSEQKFLKTVQLGSFNPSRYLFRFQSSTGTQCDPFWRKNIRVPLTDTESETRRSEVRTMVLPQTTVNPNLNLCLEKIKAGRWYASTIAAAVVVAAYDVASPSLKIEQVKRRKKKRLGLSHSCRHHYVRS